MIERYVKDIKCSLKHKCYFSALSLALALPDMCGMAEYPEEQSVSKRYMDWYDKYLGAFLEQGHKNLSVGNPWMSGEIVYNLRNTYLHQGSPNVNSTKVKEETNRLDRFIVVIGDGTVVWDSSLNLDFGHGNVFYKAIIVDITYLCENLCDCALEYYRNNRNKFTFNFDIVTQDEILDSLHDKNTGDAKDGQVERIISHIAGHISEDIVNILKANGKRTQKGGKRVQGQTKASKPGKDQNQTKSSESGKDQNQTKSSESGKDQNQTKASESGKDQNQTKNHPQPAKKEKETSNGMGKREQQMRSFFGIHFKKKNYVDKKEEIIQAVLSAETKQQVNNNLMKLFTSEEVKVIYQRLQSFIKELPGK